jgi:hypothetical protein
MEPSRDQKIAYVSCLCAIPASAMRSLPNIMSVWHAADISAMSINADTMSIHASNGS